MTSFDKEVLFRYAAAQLSPDEMASVRDSMITNDEAKAYVTETRNQILGGHVPPMHWSDSDQEKRIQHMLNRFATVLLPEDDLSRLLHAMHQNAELRKYVTRFHSALASAFSEVKAELAQAGFPVELLNDDP